MNVNIVFKFPGTTATEVNGEKQPTITNSGTSPAFNAVITNLAGTNVPTNVTVIGANYNAYPNVTTVSANCNGTTVNYDFPGFDGTFDDNDVVNLASSNNSYSLPYLLFTPQGSPTGNISLGSGSNTIPIHIADVQHQNAIYFYEFHCDNGKLYGAMTDFECLS